MGAFTSQLVVWVQYGESVVKIREVPSAADVDDLIKAIKSELAEELKGIGRTQIELHRKEEERGDIKYRHDQLVYDILALGVGVSTNPILVKITQGTFRIPQHVIY